MGSSFLCPAAGLHRSCSPLFELLDTSKREKLLFIKCAASMLILMHAMLLTEALLNKQKIFAQANLNQ